MGLFAAIGKFFSPVPASPAPKTADAPQGIGGPQIVGNFLRTNERNPDLASVDRRMAKYQEISLNCTIIAASLRYIYALVASSNWKYKPPQAADPKGVQPGNLTEAEAKQAKEYADAITLNMKNMRVPWFKVVRNAAQFKPVGFSVQECIADRMDDIMPGYIGIIDVQNRPQYTFEQWHVDPQSGEVIAWGQRDPNTAELVELERDRCIYIVDDTLTNQPDGVGLLRHVVQVCDEIKRLEQLEIWSYETDLRGIPIGMAPLAVLDNLVATNRLTEADKSHLLEGITNFIQFHSKNPELGLLLDSSVYTSQDAARTPSGAKMWGLELAKGNGAGHAEIAQAIERKQHEAGRALGTEQFMLGAGGKGSLALSEDKARALIELINGIMMEVAWCLDQDYVLRIFMLNRWPIKLRGELLPDATSLRSVSVIVDALSKLALAGAVIDRNDPVINELRRMLKLVDQPYVTPEMIAATKPPNAGGTPGEKGPNAPKPLTSGEK